VHHASFAFLSTAELFSSVERVEIIGKSSNFQRQCLEWGEVKAMSTVQPQSYAMEHTSSCHPTGMVASLLRDGDLIKQAQAGSQIAFEALVERYISPLHNFIAHYFSDRDQRCDVLQQVLIQLYLSLPDLRTDRTIQAWLFRVARNRCLDELRRKHVPNFSELITEESEEEALIAEGAQLLAPSAEDQAEQHEMQYYLCQAIADLPQKYRPIVWLRYTSLLTFGEIGRILHIPEATAKTYFQRAKERLRQSLEQFSIT
jgi:RNA polymerase sigma factor (sigma-70 family)